MPKLLHSSASPYSAKVRMAATYAGIDYELVATETSADPAQLIDQNPLGKIPTFIPEEGPAIFDSRAITQFLNRQSGNKLFPRNAAKRTEAEVMEALADGTMDCLLAHVMERRSRPAERVEQAWLDRQWAKVERSLDHLVANTPNLPSRIHVGHIAVRALLSYLSLRFEGKWEKGRSKLKRWAARFDAKFPELAALVSKA